MIYAPLLIIKALIASPVTLQKRSLTKDTHDLKESKFVETCLPEWFLKTATLVLCVGSSLCGHRLMTGAPKTTFN